MNLESWSKCRQVLGTPALLLVFAWGPLTHSITLDWVGWGRNIFPVSTKDSHAEVTSWEVWPSLESQRDKELQCWEMTDLLDGMGQKPGCYSFPCFVSSAQALWPLWPCPLSWFMLACGTWWQKWTSMACCSALLAHSVHLPSGSSCPIIFQGTTLLTWVPSQSELLWVPKSENYTALGLNLHLLFTHIKCVSRARLLVFQSQLFHLLAVWPGTSFHSHLCSLASLL